MDSDGDRNDTNDTNPSDVEGVEENQGMDGPGSAEEGDAAENDESVDDEDDVAAADDDTPEDPVVQNAPVTKLTKPLSAYFHFLATKRPAVKDENPGLGIGPVQKILSTMWSELDADAKEPYVVMATADKERYLKEKQELLDQGIDVDALATKTSKRSDDSVLTLPNGRVKRIMTTDPDVNKVSKEAVLAITKATELFIQYLTTKAHDSAVMSKRKTIKDSDVVQAIHSHAVLDWLRDDFPEKKKAPSAHKKPATVATPPQAAASSTKITSFFTRD